MLDGNGKKIEEPKALPAPPEKTIMEHAKDSMEDNKELLEKLAQDEKREKMKQLLKTLGVETLREDLDNANQKIEYLGGELTKAILMINKQSDIVNGGQVAGAQGSDPNAAKIQQLQQLAELAGVIKNVLAPSQQQTSSPLGIDQSYINDFVGQTVKDQLELGSEITAAIRRSLTGKTSRGIMQNIMQGEDPQHGPNT